MKLEETSQKGTVLSWERVQELHVSRLTGLEKCFVRKLIAVSSTEELLCPLADNFRRTITFPANESNASVQSSVAVSSSLSMKVPHLRRGLGLSPCVRRTLWPRYHVETAS